MTDAERAKHAFEEALKNREARVAILVHDNIHNALSLLDEQPASVVEMLIEHAKELPRTSTLKRRYKMRVAIIEYLEDRLHEARAQERQLAEAITGAEHLPNE
jgi:Mg2+/Co2+ transporter CorB